MFKDMILKVLIGAIFVGVYVVIFIMFNIVTFPHILSCKEKGEALVVAVDSHIDKDSDGDETMFYRPTYEIDGMTIESKVSTNSRVTVGDSKKVVYNIEHQVCYTMWDRIFYWVFILGFSPFLLLGLLLWKDVIWKLLQATVLVWLVYKQQKDE